MTAQTQIETLSAIARQCLDECDGDKVKAAIAVDAILKSNLDLRASRHVAKEALKRLYLSWNKTAYVDTNLALEAAQ